MIKDTDDTRSQIRGAPHHEDLMFVPSSMHNHRSQSIQHGHSVPERAQGSAHPIYRNPAAILNSWLSDTHTTDPEEILYNQPPQDIQDCRISRHRSTSNLIYTGNTMGTPGTQASDVPRREEKDGQRNCHHQHSFQHAGRTPSSSSENSATRRADHIIEHLEHQVKNSNVLCSAVREMIGSNTKHHKELMYEISHQSKRKMKHTQQNTTKLHNMCKAYARIRSTCYQRYPPLKRV